VASAKALLRQLAEPRLILVETCPRCGEAGDGAAGDSDCGDHPAPPERRLQDTTIVIERDDP
jgi:hypothetical protein